MIGGDSRKSTGILKDIFKNILISAGVNIIDVGMAPTPTIQFLTKRFEADCGIAVTASHNPAEWNGWKLIRSDGLFFYPNEMEEWLAMWRNAKPKQSESEGTMVLRSDAQLWHVERVLECVSVAAVRARRFKVVVDSCNGAGSHLLPRLLWALGCEVIPIANDPTQPFPRNPEPLPENLSALSQAVKDAGADIGLAQDADADRLAIVNEMGEPIGEEWTLALAVKYVLEQNADVIDKKVVINLSTSQSTESIAKDLGSEVIRTPVGEINVSKTMREIGALIGGEGNGGVIYPKIGYGRDSLTAASLVLALLAVTGKSLGEVLKTLPTFYGFKKKISVTSTDEAALLLKRAEENLLNLGAQNIDHRDGIRADLPGGWVHIRGSNTETVVRIIGEEKGGNGQLEKTMENIFSPS